MDEENRYCAGCFRTLDEIAHWQSMTDSQKKRVYMLIEERRNSSGKKSTSR
ncbi:hypothetical protein MROS_1523 [Melioribacter roseus P3M-2]|uniref:Fe-S protein n=2 Tax=Melioribacteraceae TaxID=1334117 RepID=I6Z6H0_MELRP|nr:hypothetical protein MROS_1523 [Melioribacter roseus P3M-2]